MGSGICIYGYPLTIIHEVSRGGGGGYGSERRGGGKVRGFGLTRCRRTSEAATTESGRGWDSWLLQYRTSLYRLTITVRAYSNEI